MVARKSAALHEQFEQLELGFSLFEGFFPGGGVVPLPLNIGKIVGPCSCVGSMCSTLCTECMDVMRLVLMACTMDAAPINIERYMRLAYTMHAWRSI